MMTVFFNESNAAFLTLRPAILPNSLLIILCHPLDQFGAGRASPHPTNSVRVCRLGVRNDAIQPRPAQNPRRRTSGLTSLSKDPKATGQLAPRTRPSELTRVARVEVFDTIAAAEPIWRRLEDGGALFHFPGSISDVLVLYGRARGTFNDPNVLAQRIPVRRLARRLLLSRACRGHDRHEHALPVRPHALAAHLSRDLCSLCRHHRRERHHRHRSLAPLFPYPRLVVGFEGGFAPVGCRSAYHCLN